MKTKDWFQRLLKVGITHISEDGDQEPQLIQTRVKFMYPHVNHQTAYTSFRVPGLSPRMKLVLYRLKNDL